MKRLVTALVLTFALPVFSDSPSAPDSGGSALPPALDFYLSARLAEAGEHYREALELYAKALEADPGNVEIRIAYADLLDMVGMPSRAASLLDGRNDLDWYGRKVLATALAREAMRRPELLPEAEARLREVLAERADEPNVAIDLARVLMRSGKAAEAAAELRGLRRQYPGDPRIALLYANALKLAGRPDEAIEIYRDCADDPVVGEQCRSRLVDLLTAAGRVGKAADLLLETAPPDDLGARLEAASLQLEAGRPDEALIIVRGVLAREPDSPEALRIEADALVRLGRIREAEAVLRKLLRHDPDDVAARLTLAWAAVARGSIAEARKEVTRAWRAAGEDGSSPAGVQVCVAAARVELIAGRPAAAREWLGRIGDPSLAGRNLPVLLAETYRRTGDWRDGVGALLRLQPRLEGEAREVAQALEAEMRLRSGDRRGLDRLRDLTERGSAAGAEAALTVLQGLEMWQELLDASERVLDRFPEDAAARFARASALERLGRREEAVAAFREILRDDPDDAVAANYLGYMWADAGEHLDEALRLIERAVAAEPDSGAYLDSLGWVHFRLGHLDEAERWLRRAIEKGATDGTVLAHLGEVLLARGKREEALEYLRRALELGCEHEDHVRKLLERAQGKDGDGGAAGE